MSEIVISGFIGCLGIAKIVAACVGYRRGRAAWFAGRSLSLDADAEDDPVGFTTAVWGNAVQGVLMLWLAVCLYIW
jgi:hypothetical protein